MFIHPDDRPRRTAACQPADWQRADPYYSCMSWRRGDFRSRAFHPESDKRWLSSESVKLDSHEGVKRWLISLKTCRALVLHPHAAPKHLKSTMTPAQKRLAGFLTDYVSHEEGSHMTLEACSATVLESAPNIFKDLKTEDTSKSKNAFIGTVVTAWSKIDMKPQARIGGVSLSSVWPGLK